MSIRKEKHFWSLCPVSRQSRICHWSYNRIKYLESMSMPCFHSKSSIYIIVTLAHFEVPLCKIETHGNFETLRRYHLASLENIIFNYHSMRYF